MANQEYLDILKQGKDVWNSWREKNSNRKIDLSGADLSGDTLNEVNLRRVNLIGANLSGTKLIHADLSVAILDNADFSMADLTEADLGGSLLWEARLCNAYLRDADLVVASLLGADLSGADLSNAQLLNANLIKANFSQAILVGADLHQATLTGALLDKAILNNANLSGANLSGASLCEADLIGANLNGANLFEAKLSGADLSKASLVETNLTKATLTDCSIYGISAWKVLLDGAIQINLKVTPSYEPTITVDDLEVAQLIYLLLNHEKLRKVLNSVMERGVLLLGRFSDGGHELLQAVAAKLRGEGYLPIIFDFDRPYNRNLTETVITLVGLSRFVIADLSGRSVANELRATVPHFKIPFVPIVEQRRKKEVFSMFTDFLENDWVLPLVAFTSTEHLLGLLPSKIIMRAEKKCTARQRRLNKLFKQ